MIHSSAWARIRGLEPLSLCDWPGRVTAVVFLGGCNLRCPHCHNGSLAWRQSEHPALDPVALAAFFKARGRWLDGVVITGGEPTLDPDLPALVADLSATGLPVKVDTNGMRPEVVRQVIAACPETSFSVDVKAPFDKYPLVTGSAVTAEAAGRDLERIFGLARHRPDRFAFRTTLVPELDEADLAGIREVLPAGCRYVTQQFNPVVATRKEGRHAQTDPKTRWMPGDMVDRAHRPGHFKGA